MTFRAFIFITVILSLSMPAHAYIGPGLAASTVGVIIGLVGSILIAVFAIFWYPIKRTFKKLFPKDSQDVEIEAVDDTEKAEPKE